MTGPLGLPESNTQQTPIHGDYDLDSSQGKQAEVPCMQVGPGSPRAATFGKPGESSPEPPRENTAGWGEGRRGNRQAGIGKAAGGVKICRWRDVRMPGKREDPDQGSEGARGADSGIYHEWGPELHPASTHPHSLFQCVLSRVARLGGANCSLSVPSLTPASGLMG